MFKSIILVTFFVIAGCNSDNNNIPNVQAKEYVNVTNGEIGLIEIKTVLGGKKQAELSEVTIKGHAYIVVECHSSITLTHAGHCKAVH